MVYLSMSTGVTWIYNNMDQSLPDVFAHPYLPRCSPKKKGYMCKCTLTYCLLTYEISFLMSINSSGDACHTES